MKHKKDRYSQEQLHYWWLRFIASDPGHIRLHWAAKTIVSVIFAVSIMGLITFLMGNKAITVIMFSGVIALQGNVTVNDDTIRKKKVTTLLLLLSSGTALSLGTFLTVVGYHLVDVLLVSIIFCALYFQRFASRYFSIFMVAFMSIYFSALLHIGFNQLGLLYIAIIVGITVAYCVNFVFWKAQPERTLDRAVVSFRIQVNLTLDLIIEMISELKTETRRIKSLNYNVAKLNEYARTVTDHFDSNEDISTWRNIEFSHIRLYIFDAAMLIETLSSAVRQLKALRAFEQEKLRAYLLELMQCLRHVSAFHRQNNTLEMVKAEQISNELESYLKDIRSNDKVTEDWFYLIRRVKSIADHIIEGIRTIHDDSEWRSNGSEERQEPYLQSPQSSLAIEDELKPRLYPETKRAIQAAVAASLAILLGYLFSPSHTYWMLLAAYLVFLGTTSVGRTVVKAGERFLGTFLGAIAGFALDNFISGYLFIEIPLLFLCVFLAFYLLKVSYTLLSFWITMMLAIMYNLLLGDINEQLLVSRVFDTLVGAGLGALATAFLLPQRTRDQVNESIIDFLRALGENTNIFLEGYMGKEPNATLAEKVFLLDSKFQKIKDEAEPLTKSRFRLGYWTMTHRITAIAALVYYAKHLLASSNRINKPSVGPTLPLLIERVQECLNENIETLCKLLSHEVKGTTIVWDLQLEREIIERGPNHDESGVVAKQLINDFYYIWKINKGILSLAKQLGAQKRHRQSSNL